jgi:hypothetical protein
MSLDLSELLRPSSSGQSAPQVNNNLSKPVESVPESGISIRQNAARRYDKRCAILRVRSTRDIAGGATPTWVQVGGTECAVEPIGKPTETPTGSGAPVSPLQSVSTDFIFMPIDSDVIAEDRIGVPGWFNAFKPGAYEVGQKIIPSRKGGNGHFYVVARGGDTGLAPEPKPGANDYPTNKGGIITIGTVTFREAGTCEFFEVVGTNRGETDALQLVCFAKRVE